MSDRNAEIRREIRDRREKRIYHLMTAAGAALGFSLTQAGDLTPELSTTLFYISLYLWAASFTIGMIMTFGDFGVTEHENPTMSKTSRAVIAAMLLSCEIMQAVFLMCAALSFLWWKISLCEGCAASFWDGMVEPALDAYFR